MFDFNPIASMELLQNLHDCNDLAAADSVANDPERGVQEAQPVGLTELFRRMFRRCIGRRAA
ncbi:MAG: hypothetical protein QOE14_645 [Humisphaera sp.]|nr:hypothetical protein [Humisphaera sp.]